MSWSIPVNMEQIPWKTQNADKSPTYVYIYIIYNMKKCIKRNIPLWYDRSYNKGKVWVGWEWEGGDGIRRGRDKGKIWLLEIKTKMSMI